MTRPRQRPDEVSDPAVRAFGFGARRITLADLRDPQIRQQLLARGITVLVQGRGLLKDNDRALLEAHRDLVLAYEVVLSQDELPGLRGAAADWPVPLRLAPSPPAPAGHVGLGRIEQSGFGAGELDRLSDLDLKEVGLFAGIVVRLGTTDEVFRTSLLVASTTGARELDATLSISLAPEADEPTTIRRVIEAAFAALALPEVDVLPNPLPDSAADDLRAAAAAVIRTTTALPPVRKRGFAWTIRQGDHVVHGYQSAAGIECLITSADGSLPIQALRLPVALPATGSGTATAALTGRDRPIRFAAPTDQPHTIRLEPPVVVEGPLILRLEACRDA